MVGDGLPKKQLPLGITKFLDGKLARLDIGQVFIDEEWRQGLPPGVVLFPEIGHDLEVFGGDILGLAAIGEDVVEFCVVNQAPATGAHGAPGVF